MGFIIFLAVFLSVYGSMHAYVYWSFLKGFSYQVNWVGISLCTFGTLSYVLASILNRYGEMQGPLYMATYWMGFLSIVLSCLIIKDVLVVLTPFVAAKVTLFALILAVIMSSYSIYNGHRLPETKTVPLKLEHWAEQQQPFRLILLTDLHLNPRKSIKRLKHIVQLTNQQNPDLIVITGDLLDESIDQYPEYAQALTSLKAKYGVYACSGNHEYYLQSFRKFYENASIQLLENNSVVFPNELQLIGLNDPAGSRRGTGPDFDLAFNDVDKQKPIIVLNHTPKTELVEASWGRGADLVLGGHTHAGQIPPMSLLVRLVFKYTSGLYLKNDKYVYTSPGTWTWGPPFRFTSKNEITLFLLDHE